MYSGAKLKAALEFQGRSGQWLADRTGYDQSTVSRFLNGRQPMSTVFVERAAELLGVPIEWLRVDESELVNAS